VAAGYQNFIVCIGKINTSLIRKVQRNTIKQRSI
jgi:hypothetical protein